MTSKSIGHNPNTLGAQYLENSWRCNNRCCETVRYYWATSILGSWPDFTMNKGHSNLAKGDIAHRMQKKSCRYLLSYTPSDSTRSEVGLVRGVFWLHRGSAMVPFERAMMVSYRLSIVTVALSLTTRPQFAIECLGRSNQQGVGQFVLNHW